MWAERMKVNVPVKMPMMEVRARTKAVMSRMRAEGEDSAKARTETPAKVRQIGHQLISAANKKKMSVAEILYKMTVFA